MLWFIQARLMFIAIEILFGYEISLKHFFQALFYGAYMDLSTVGYLLLLPLLLFLIHRYIPFYKIVKAYSALLLVVLAGLYAVDAMLYHEWGYRMDHTAFRYLSHAREAGNFISWINVAGCVLLFGWLLFSGWALHRKLQAEIDLPYHGKILATNVLAFGLLIIPIRGGIDIIPMNPGKIFFCNQPFANHAALNVPWNLLYSLEKERKNHHQVALLSEQEANQLFQHLVKDSSSLEVNYLRTKKPKILFLLLESFTANLIFQKYQGEEMTPGLNKLFSTGIYFNQAYATGDRTEMGIGSALSGFPAQPYSSILNHPDKTLHLPSIVRDLARVQYHTSFYYGGDASFASMNSYFLNAGCETIIDKTAFPASSYNAKWGVHDHLLFERIYEDIWRDTSLFFRFCLSLSSHPPYEVPEPKHFHESGEESQFVNTAFYTDKHLSLLIDRLRQLPLWDSLLVIAVADHGARYPGNHDYHLPSKFHIPLWFGGGAVSIDTTIQTIVSQCDIPAILFDFLDMDRSAYRFSKNPIKAHIQPFAFYAFNNGYGLIDSCGKRSYTIHPYALLYQEGRPCLDESYGKAYLQKVVEEFHEISNASSRK